jgi:hypothetical protein
MTSGQWERILRQKPNWPSHYSVGPDAFDTVGLRCLTCRSEFYKKDDSWQQYLAGHNCEQIENTNG